jgi:hypothetical protein
MKGGQVQHLVILPILATLELSKSLPKPDKLYYVTICCALIWVFNIFLSLSCWCFLQSQCFGLLRHIIKDC